MRRIVLFVLFVLAAAGQLTFAQEDTGNDALVVISYNIRNGEANDGTNSWRYRYPCTLLMLQDQKPDIMGVQEAYDYQVLLISENMRDYKAIGVGREDGKSEGEHMSIFYNKKTVSLKKWGTFWLSETPDKPSLGWDAACRRTATWAIMKDKRNGRDFLYVNTHLDHVGKAAQRNGLDLILSKIKEMNNKNLPVVLTGDFNVEPDDSVLDVLDGSMVSARDVADKTDSHGTYSNWGKESSIIDYIWYSGFSSCPEYQTITKKYGGRAFISDHYPVKAVLRF